MNVFVLLKKDARQTLVLGAGFLFACLIVAVFAGVIPPRLFVPIGVLLHGIFVLGAIMLTERYEDRNKGYGQIMRLPVLPSEIATGKLGLIYLINGLSCVLLLLVAGVHAENARGFILLIGCGWLLLIPPIYWGICIFGYTKFTLILRVTVMALLVLIQLGLLLLFRAGPGGAASMAKISDAIARAPWLVICLLASVLYFSLVPPTAGFMRRHAARNA